MTPKMIIKKYSLAVILSMMMTLCLNYCQMSPTIMKSRKARLITLEKIPLCGVISLLTESGRNRAVKWYIHKRALETKKGIVYETEE